MRAVVVRDPGGPEALRLEEIPDPVAGPDEVVVAVESAGVNPVDLGNRSDTGWAGLTTPYVVGYEFAGTVIEAAGTGPAPGEPVWGLLPVRGTRWGAYGERVVAPAALVGTRPAMLEPLDAAALPLAGGTAWQVLRRLALPPGAWLLVIGAAGGVGHLLVQLATREGIRVVAVCSERDRDRVLGLGAEAWVDRGADPADAVRRRLGHEVDAVVDLVGGGLEAAQRHVRLGGALATVVDLEGNFDEAVDRNLSIHGVLLAPSAELLRDLAAAVREGLRPRVACHAPLEQAGELHTRLERGGVGGKLVLTP